MVDPETAPARSAARAITSSLVGEPDETAGPRSRLFLLRNCRSSAAALDCAGRKPIEFSEFGRLLGSGHHNCRARGRQMGWGNQARAQMRRSGSLRVAWASFFAALYLALPIGSTPQGTRPRPAAPLEAIP